MTRRPDRLRLPDESGRLKTLPGGREHFRMLGKGRDVLFLGLGPEPRAWPGGEFSGRRVAYVEHPEFEAGAGAREGYAAPSGFERVEPEAVDPALARSSEVWVYEPGVRLRPSFWSPILGRVRAAKLGDADGSAEVWLPAREGGLLVRELGRAFERAGFGVRRVDADRAGAEVPELLARTRPRLYFSVNFQGLDPHGEMFHLLEACGARVAVWCVDNPFHLLTAQRSAWWTRAALFATDAWFLPRLARHGAETVRHLPLAASREFADRAARGPVSSEAGGLDDRLVFVGRSAFPGREAFFAGCELDQDLADRGLAMLELGERPDFGWWAEGLGIESWWPGNAVRRAGFGAETCARAWRGLCLERASRAPLTVFGDKGWAEIVPGLDDLRDPVDYYGPLAGIYAGAGACLNVTSLLLPSGLTQRHFDVWSAGGLLLTDATPGLDVFPEDLARETSFKAAAEIPNLFARLRKDPTLAGDLKKAWTGEIEARHTYDVRAADVLESLDVRP